MPKKIPSPKRSEPIKKLPKPPATLNADGKTYWKEIGGELIKINALTELHLRSLEVMCNWWAEYVELQRWCIKNPEMASFMTDSGYIAEHPFVRQRQNAFNNLQKLWAKFGLTPVALQAIGKHGGGNGAVNPVLAFAASKHDDEDY